MPGRHHHDEFESNQFLGKELKYFSQAGFDLDRIHIKVSLGYRASCNTIAGTGKLTQMVPSAMPPSHPSTKMPS